jgi:hypothetical protein
MRVEFDLASLSGAMLETFRLELTRPCPNCGEVLGIPVLAAKVDEWLTKEIERRRRKKTARQQTMVLPLLCEKELECGLVVHVQA